MSDYYCVRVGACDQLCAYVEIRQQLCEVAALLSTFMWVMGIELRFWFGGKRPYSLSYLIDLGPFLLVFSVLD